MKKIVTMLGTSVFDNYFEKSLDSSLSVYYEQLKKKRAKMWDKERERIDRLRNKISEWIKKQGDKISLSAEVKSLIKLREELQDELEVYLLYSDTILSKLASEFVKDILIQCQFKHEDIKPTIHIKGLQVWDRTEFNKGMANLITAVYDIAQGYWENVVMNITGGYKATIPYLTILAQINGCPIYYIFEETDALIKIPNIHMSKEWLNWERLAEYEDLLKKADKGIDSRTEYEGLKNSTFYKEYSFLLWEEIIDDHPLVELNPMGKIIFEKYKEKHFSFFCTDEVWSIINSDRRLEKLIKGQFSKRIFRSEKTETKNGHLVYDAGDNQLRIFYREKDDAIYIYKVFNDHDKYEQYLKKMPYSDNILNQKFDIRRIRKEE